VYFQQFGSFFVYLLLFVDGMLIISKDKSLINMSNSQVSDEFKMTDLCTAKKNLGMGNHRDCNAGKFFYLKESTLKKYLIGSI